MREIYLPAFEASARQEHAASVVCAYPRVNGTFCCENDLLMNQILKNEWRLDGFVTSDFGAVHSTVPSAMAGLDLEMPRGRSRCPCSGGHRLPTGLHAAGAAPGAGGGDVHAGDRSARAAGGARPAGAREAAGLELMAERVGEDSDRILGECRARAASASRASTSSRSSGALPPTPRDPPRGPVRHAPSARSTVRAAGGRIWERTGPRGPPRRRGFCLSRPECERPALPGCL